MDGGRCSYEKGSQLDQALAFLHAHSYTTRLVTLTIGANDVTPCLSTTDMTGCVASRLTVLAANLHLALSQIRAAAPDAQIVVTNYYDPFLAAWFGNHLLAMQTLALQGALNQTIASVASADGAVTADVAAAFESTTTTLVSFGGRSCRPTWCGSASTPGCARSATSTPTTPGTR